MLDIHIENPEIEKSIRQTYGDDDQAIAKAFFEFIQQQKIKQDIGVSIKQLEAGESVPLKDVMQGIRAKYE